MSRTYRKVHPVAYRRINTWGDYYAEYVSKLNRDGSTGGRYPYNPGYRSGLGGFLDSGTPTGWDDDYGRTPELRRLVNRRRRVWDKKIINDELVMLELQKYDCYMLVGLT